MVSGLAGVAPPPSTGPSVLLGPVCARACALAPCIFSPDWKLQKGRGPGLLFLARPPVQSQGLLQGGLGVGW